MKIEQKFQNGLKKLVKEKPLDEVNVLMLCKEVNSNRQTFYYHYRDISDVVESILLKEKINYRMKIIDFSSVMKSIFNYINSNFSFLYTIANSYASETMFSFFYSHFYTNLNIITKNNKKVNFEIIRMLSNLYSKELMYWIINKRKEKQNLLTKKFQVIWEYFTKEYLIDLSNK